MADVLNAQVVDDVTASNFKIVAGAAGEAQAMMARAAALSFQEYASYSSMRISMANQLFFKAGEELIKVDPTEAISVAKELAASTDLPTTLGNLQAALAAFQQFVKSAQTTPPVTTGA